MAKKPSTKRSSSPITGAIMAVMEERELTAYAVAKKAEVSPSIITRWQRGEREPSLQTIEAVMRALDLKLVGKEVRWEQAVLDAPPLITECIKEMKSSRLDRQESLVLDHLHRVQQMLKQSS